MPVSNEEDVSDGEQRRGRRYDGRDADVDSIILPDPAAADVAQDAEWCEVAVNGTRERVRFHDYGRIFETPGLYERLFYDILQCDSPRRVVAMLDDVLEDQPGSTGALRVLDVGAGNGIVGEELATLDPDCVIGLDILPEARQAAGRDRPEAYDDYVVTDLTDMRDDTVERLEARDFNCLVSVATLGFNDIPPEAFAAAADLVQPGGWLAFNLKEDFLRDEEQSGFARLIARLRAKGIVRVEAYRRYRHRLSVAGKPLHYVAMVGRKLQEIPTRLVDEVISTAPA